MFGCHLRCQEVEQVQRGGLAAGAGALEAGIGGLAPAYHLCNLSSLAACVSPRGNVEAGVVLADSRAQWARRSKGMRARPRARSGHGVAQRQRRSTGLFIFNELSTLTSDIPRPGVGGWEEKAGHVSMLQPPHHASLRRKLQELRRKVPQCLLQLPQAALRARAKRWLGAAFALCPLACFQMFQAAARGVLSGSVSLDLLSCGFSPLCFSPAGYHSFRDEKRRLSPCFLNCLPTVPFSEDPWPCFGQTAGYLIKYSFSSNNVNCLLCPLDHCPMSPPGKNPKTLVLRRPPPQRRNLDSTARLQLLSWKELD
ncbi:hypothetical protein VULLAG_LOCUS18378 [Vulpes lagopus]